MSSNSLNGGIGLKGTTWGAHLNRSNEVDSNYKKKSKIKIQERKPLFKTLSPSNSSTPKQLSFQNKLPSHESYLAKQETVLNNSLSQGPRSSLKKRKSGFSLNRTKSSDFFNTLGFGDDSLSQDSLPSKLSISNDGDKYINEESSEPIKSFKSDPLARFESELSMDGDSFREHTSSNISETKLNTNQILNVNKSAQIARPLSFLGAIGTNSGESRTRGSLGISFGDFDSNISHSYETQPNISKTDNELVRRSDNPAEETAKSQEKRKREESSDQELDTSLNHSQIYEPQKKKFCLSEDVSDFSESYNTNTFKSFGKSIEAKYIVSERNNDDLSNKDFCEKENWQEIEKRLSKPSVGNEHKDVYSLGFEEEEDVASAKISAAAGHTALLPLHDSSNISNTTVQNLQKQRLMEKVQSGKANENYQKINLKKKVFVRGRAGRMTGAKYRRQEWKKKMTLKEKAESKLKSKKDDSLASSSDKQPTTTVMKSKKHDDKLNIEQSFIVENNDNDNSFETEDEYVPKEKVKKSTLKAKSNKSVKKPRKKPVKQNKANSNVSNNYEVNSDSNAEKGQETDPWGQEVDDADLLNCFDEKGDLKIINEPSTSQQNQTLPGIGCKVDPYYSSNFEYNRQEVLDILRNKFGHKEFRAGQEEAIRRILCGNSTLVQLATGSGKSLVYQLPAYLYAERNYCITLVVSPLVSLMEDQLSGLPNFLRAACFHSSQTQRQREKVVEEIKNAASGKISNRIHFLLVSPETLAGGGSLFASVLRYLPPISFVCIDEAHCVSAWSHNFRPTYLRLSRVIKERLGVETLLGLTASAPESTIKDVAQRLNVNLTEGIIRGKLLPTNLTLSVSRGESRGRGKEGDLIALLSSEPFIDYSSIIVYCTRRDTCEKLATLIRTQFQDRDVRLNKSNKVVKKTRAVSLVSEPYHAGLSAYKRKTVQNQFMSGKLRIVVATVAFGMGIDKSDIRAVIHYNMPSSYESYVQEIGRAGRDGLHARCHLFLDSEGKDLCELKRHIYSNSIDRHIIRKLVTEIMQRSNPKLIENECSKKNDEEEIETTDLGNVAKRIEIAVPIQKLVEKFDMPEENISTFMCYLEEHEKEWVKLLNPTYASCKLHCYGGHSQLEILCRSNPIVAAAYKIANHGKDVKNKCNGTIDFPIVQVASKSGWDSGVVKRELKNLQWANYSGSDGKMKQSGILVEFSELALHFEMKHVPCETDLEDIQNYLYKRSVAREMAELENLKGLSNAFRKVSFLAGNMPREVEETDSMEERLDSKVDCIPNELTMKSDKLKIFLKEYFDNTTSAVENALSNLSYKDDGTFSVEVPLNISEDIESQLRAEVRQFVVTHSDHSWTGRAVARIFHGIQSPNFPAKQWGRVRRYWRAHLDIDFPVICKIATQEVLRLRCGRK